jgi:hypothetical protein
MWCMVDSFGGRALADEFDEWFSRASEEAE